LSRWRNRGREGGREGGKEGLPIGSARKEEELNTRLCNGKGRERGKEGGREGGKFVLFCCTRHVLIFIFLLCFDFLVLTCGHQYIQYPSSKPILFILLLSPLSLLPSRRHHQYTHIDYYKAMDEEKEEEEGEKKEEEEEEGHTPDDEKYSSKSTK